MSGPTVGALFAGVGALELALSRVWPDAHPAWFSQYEPPSKSHPRPTQAPSKVLAHHWPGVPNHGDITTIDWAQVDPVDVLTGGFPCQDVSHAGKRAGLKAGTRSGLWSRMAEGIDALRPRLVIAENVRGLLSAEAASDVEQCPWCVGGAADGEPPLRALGAVLGDLADIGYDAAWVGLRASDVGAAHGRFRVFVLAWRQGDTDPLTWRQGDTDPLLPTPVVNDMGDGKTVEWWDEWTARLKSEHGNGNGHGASLAIEALRLLPTPTAQVANNGGTQHPDKRIAGGHTPTIADVVEHLPMLPTPTTRDIKGRNQRDDETCLTGALLPTPRATRGGSTTETTYLFGGQRTDADRTQGRVLIPTPNVADAMGGHATRSGDRSYELLLPGLGKNPDRWAQYGPAIRRQEHAFGRPAPDPTEPTGKNGAHRLSARFDEWLMGWPDGWVTDVPDVTRNDAIRACGNGVVPPQAAAAITHLLAVREAARATQAVAS